MPITIRTTQPNILSPSVSAYNTHKQDLDCVSILTYQADLVTNWDSNGITISQSQVNALDASFAEIGNSGKSLILRPGISMNTRASLNSTYNAYKNMTEAMGVEWIIGYVSGDPTSGGQLYDFPYMNDPQMRILTRKVYEFLKDYLSATDATAINGVTFGACPCNNPSTLHSRKNHVYAVACIKPTFQFHEMVGGQGDDPVAVDMNAALFHQAEINVFGTGLGTTSTSENRVLRAQRVLEEWDWTLGMVWNKLGTVARTTIATGTVFAQWTVNDYLEQWATYPPGWLTLMRTNLKVSYYENPSSSSTNDKAHLAQAAALGISIGMQTASTGLTGAGWGMDQISATEHILNGAESDGTPAVGYGDIAFIELQPDRLNGGTVSSTAVGDWNGGSVSASQYYLTHANSVNSRTNVFTPWTTDSPPTGESGTYSVLGSYTSDPGIIVEPPPPSGTSIREWAAKTWVLDQVGSVTEIQNTETQVRTALGRPGVVGYSVRARWSTLEPSQGVYDLSIFDKARQLHPTAKLAIRFMAGVGTPSFYLGGGHLTGTNPTWYDTQGGKLSGPYPTPFKPDGTPGNATFEAGYRNLANRLVQWALDDQAKCKAAGYPEAGCRLIHFAMYGRLWAEMANNSASTNPGTVNAGIADGRFDSNGNPVTSGGTLYNYPNALQGMPGYGTGLPWVQGHQKLIEIARTAISGTNIVMEYPGSGFGAEQPTAFANPYNAKKGVANYLWGWAGDTLPEDLLIHQANDWAGAYGYERPNDTILFGVQSYSVHGSTYTGTGGKNAYSWSKYYTDAAAAGALYSEVYLESFTDSVDYAALSGPMSNWTPNPTPTSTGNPPPAGNYFSNRRVWVCQQVSSTSELNNTYASQFQNVKATVPATTGLSVRMPWDNYLNNKNVLDAGKALADANGMEFSFRPMAGVHTPTAILNAMGSNYIAYDGTQPFPKPFHSNGTAGNPVFEAEYEALLRELAAWMTTNGVRLLHNSWHAMAWAELNHGIEIRSAAGYSYAAWLQGHKNLIDIAKTVQDDYPNVIMEWPLSGYGPISRASGTPAAEDLADHMVAVFGANTNKVVFQANGWGKNGQWGASTESVDSSLDPTFNRSIVVGLQAIQPWGTGTSYPQYTASEITSALNEANAAGSGGAEYLEIYTPTLRSANGGSIWATPLANWVGSTVINPPPPPPSTSIREWAKGSWVLDQVTGVAEVQSTAPAVRNALAVTNTTGYSVRVPWNLIEPTVTNPPTYNFSVFEEARAQHPNAKLAIRFMAGVHTPEPYKGYTWTMPGLSATYPCPFNDPNGPNANVVGNVSFAPAYYNLVKALAEWCLDDGNCRILHCSGYGYKWAEINALQLADPTANPPKVLAGLRAKPGFTETKWLDGHKALYKSVIDDFASSNLTLEFPGSGSDLNGMGGQLYNWVGNTYPVDRVFAQINNLGGPYNVGRVSNLVTLGGQAYAVTGAQQSKTWTEYFQQADTLKLLYTETYLESWTETAFKTASAAWTPNLAAVVPVQ